MANGGEALGRSRGGLGTKIVGVCDAAGRLVDFLLTPGQAHELAPSLTLLRRLPEAPSWAIADMACDAAEFRAEARALGAFAVATERSRADPDAELARMRARHRVGRRTADPAPIHLATDAHLSRRTGRLPLRRGGGADTGAAAGAVGAAAGWTGDLSGADQVFPADDSAGDACGDHRAASGIKLGLDHLSADGARRADRQHPPERIAAGGLDGVSDRERTTGRTGPLDQLRTEHYQHQQRRA